MTQGTLRVRGKRRYPAEGTGIYIDQADGPVQLTFIPGNRTVTLQEREQFNTDAPFTEIMVENMSAGENRFRLRSFYGSLTPSDDGATVAVSGIGQPVDVQKIIESIVIETINQVVTVKAEGDGLEVQYIDETVTIQEDSPLQVQSIGEVVTVKPEAQGLPVKAIAEPVTVERVAQVVTTYQMPAAGVVGTELVIASGTATLAANPARRLALVRQVGAVEAKIGGVVLPQNRELELPISGAIAFSGTDGAKIAVIEILNTVGE
ncbi:hypothetical protein [Endozoicomonas arenosclerae]|uniref:hypothetical protein n=1 Tax=Endozoicomonas arenosclerae TaxID=1633495 RepID=UPI000785FE6E|nr:hypothetical protein [Endozoicomonas arenosclerae]